jgi:hypothetical protein
MVLWQDLKKGGFMKFNKKAFEVLLWILFAFPIAGIILFVIRWIGDFFV